MIQPPARTSPLTRVPRGTYSSLTTIPWTQETTCPFPRAGSRSTFKPGGASRPRETLSSQWTDPTYPVNGSGAAEPGRRSAVRPQLHRGDVVVPNNGELLPDMTGTFRLNPQPFNDGLGGSTGFFTSGPATLWSAYSWEDDLVVTGVRSFDVKAYDNALAAYADLGWGDERAAHGQPVGRARPRHRKGDPLLSGKPRRRDRRVQRPGLCQREWHTV